MGTAATMAGIGAAFAWNMMKSQGWSDGDGLGKNRQGRKTAIKPKLKFDSHGLGHDRSEEFEFHWWDHLFNSAAKGVKVNEPGEGGEISVSFMVDKSERSAKKLRRRMQKDMKNQLYSRFVKSGTLQGEKLISEETKRDVVTEVKDLGKIKTLSDDDLIKACGGRTAHKGARHGHKMSAKQLRLEAAEAAFIASVQQKEADKQKKNDSKDLIVKTEKSYEHIDQETPSKKKKKSKSAEMSNDTIITEISPSCGEESVSKKRKKDKKDKVLSDSNISQDLQTLSEEPSAKKRKKDKKDKTKDLESPNDLVTELVENAEQPAKKKKKKDKKEKENLVETPVIDDGHKNALTDDIDNENITKKKKKKKSKKKSKNDETEA